MELPDNFDAFTTGYIAAIYFTEIGDIGQPSRDSVLADYSKREAIADCRKFQKRHAALLGEAYQHIGYEESTAGADFWLTRQGHGSGFWERDELSSGIRQKLSNAAHDFGEFNPDFVPEDLTIR